MDLEIIEEEKGVDIEDDRNFHKNVCSEGCRGKGTNGLKRVQESQGVINVHPDTDKTLSGMLWQVLVTSVQLMQHPDSHLHHSLAHMEKGYWRDS